VLEVWLALPSVVQRILVRVLEARERLEAPDFNDDGVGR